MIVTPHVAVSIQVLNGSNHDSVVVWEQGQGGVFDERNSDTVFPLS